MNSHSWTIASVPAKTPTPIERAGFTEVPVAGSSAKWIIASARPIASGPSAGCSLRSSVTARITHRKTAVITISSRNAAHQAKPVPWSPKEFWRHVALGAEAREAVHQHEQHERRRASAPSSCAADVEAGPALHGEPAAERGADRDGRVEVAAGDPADGVGHHQHGEAEGEAGGDVVRRRCTTAAPQPKKTSTNVPSTSAANFWRVVDVLCHGRAASSWTRPLGSGADP